MRKIKPFEILLFFIPLLLTLFLSGLVTHYLSRLIPWADYRGAFILCSFLTFCQIFAITFYRIYITIIPLPIGEIKHDSKEEVIYHMHLLFHLIFFHPIMASNILPISLMRFYSIALGAKLGDNSFSGGLLADSIFITMGSNCLVGHGSVLTPHQIENEKLAHYPITLGNNITIGTGSKILPGVKIDDDAIVGANSVVQKGTHIKRGEIWGGVPAKKIGQRNLPEA